MATYKETITDEMTWLGQQDEVVFLGQGITCGDRFYGTLDGVPKNKCIEFPIAENLMMGSAIGLALEGYRPVVLFQRMDFMLIAADQIINHLALMPGMSGNQFTLPVIIRACIGSQDKKFDVGIQHNKNFCNVFGDFLDTFEYGPQFTYKDIFKEYKNKPFMIVEEKDEYNGQFSY